MPNKEIVVETRGFADVVNITPDAQAFLDDIAADEGILTAFVPGATAGITTIEFESGCVADLQRALEALAPQDIEYEHNLRWGDGNGFSHIRAALLGPSVSIPFVDSRLALGTWQQLIVVDCDNRPRQRRVIFQV